MRLKADLAHKCEQYNQLLKQQVGEEAFNHLNELEEKVEYLHQKYFTHFLKCALMFSKVFLQFVCGSEIAAVF